MKTALAFRHVDFEDLGTLEPLLRQRGYEIRYVNPGVENATAPDVLSPALLAVLGGPIGAYDEETYPFLNGELAAIRQRLAAQTPLLGICLGAQLIARALGASVYPMGINEIGFAPLELTREGRTSPLAAIGTAIGTATGDMIGATIENTPVLHWHGDQFDIPPDAVCLAETSVCKNQAFAIGPRVLGLQFHLEADARQIERWLIGHAGELARLGIDPRVLRTQALESGAALRNVSQAVFAAWLDGL